MRAGVGSPPRAWRQFVIFQVKEGYIRFTSTRVETILEKMGINESASVHLHARGDNRRDQQMTCGRGGSPPRAWRQSIKLPPQFIFLRFTSTRVETICTAI